MEIAEPVPEAPDLSRFLPESVFRELSSDSGFGHSDTMIWNL
jgi:hypothetical protein